MAIVTPTSRTMSRGVRWFQLAVAATLVVVFAAPIAWMISDWSQVQKEKAVASTVEQLGGSVTWAGDGIGFRWPGGGRILDVHLMNTDATDGDFAKLASLRRPRGVYAQNTTITGEALVHLRGLTTLENLELGNTQVGDKGLEHLAGLTALKSLTLEATQIGDEGAAQLAGLTKMWYLDLSGTCVTDDGIEHLLSMRELERLDLEETAITDRGLMCLKDLKSSGGSVELCGTLVTDRGVAEFRKQAPNWRVSR
jgi:hypothetical protein